MIDRKRFRRGDPEYFEELMRTRGRVVLSVTQAFGQDADHAEDLLQESWVTAYARRRSYHGRGSFAAWLHRVATNVCLDDHRARMEQLEAHRAMFREDLGEGNRMRAPDPQGEEERLELHAKLHQAMAGLTKREFEAISLRIFEGNTTSEAANRMRISPATVRSIIRHAINRLRNIMEDSGDDLSGYRPSH